MTRRTRGKGEGSRRNIALPEDATLFAFCLYAGISRRLTPARCRGVCERLGRLQTETRRLVQRRRPDIERVARALMARRRLRGPEICDLLNEAA